MPATSYNQVGPTSFAGVKAVFAASLPSELASESAKRMFQTWIRALQAYAAREWHIRWDIEANIAVSPVELPDRLVQIRLEQAMGIVPVIPRDRTLVPPEGWR